MKKILLATSALIATAGMAAADIKLSGLARFGVLYVENGTVPAVAATAGPDGLDATADDTPAVAARGQTTRLESRFRLTIDGSTEADGGIKFGARVRIQSDDTATDSSVALSNAPRFTVSAGGLTLGVGNIFGAIDTNAGVYAGGQFGLAGLGWANVVTNFASDTYNSSGAGRNGVELIYTMGDFTAHISNSTKGFDRTELVLAYTFSGITVAGGYLDSNLANDVNWTLSAAGTFGGFAVAAAIASDNSDELSAALAGSYKIGAATKIGAFIAYDEGFSNVVGRDEMAYGFEVEHSLGGGATIVGGFAINHGQNNADLGVTFNF